MNDTMMGVERDVKKENVTGQRSSSSGSRNVFKSFPVNLHSIRISSLADGPCFVRLCVCTGARLCCTLIHVNLMS